jgi:hypothetical protein
MVSQLGPSRPPVREQRQLGHRRNVFPSVDEMNLEPRVLESLHTLDETDESGDTDPAIGQAAALSGRTEIVQEQGYNSQ